LIKLVIVNDSFEESYNAVRWRRLASMFKLMLNKLECNAVTYTFTKNWKKPNLILSTGIIYRQNWKMKLKS